MIIMHVNMMRKYNYTAHNKFCKIYKHMYLFSYIGEKIETNMHLEELFYLLTKTWQYGGCVCGQEVAG